MHEFVPQISIHTLHNGSPVQLRSVECRTLQGERSTHHWALLRMWSKDGAQRHGYIQSGLTWRHRRTIPYKRWLARHHLSCSANKSWRNRRNLLHIKSLGKHSKSVHLVCNFTAIMLARHSCSPCWHLKVYLWASYFSWKGETVYSDKPA